jgi:hypothetical protein
MPIMAALPSRASRRGVVGVLHGADGLHILDPEPHGSGQRAAGSGIKLYDEGLRKGELMMVIPASYPGRVTIGRLMAGNGGHAVFYFGVGHVESLTGP